MSTKHVPPVHKIRLGRVCASIWQNGPAADSDSSDNSIVRHSVSFEKTYVNKEGQFETSYSYGPADALLLAETARQAAAWMYAQRIKDRGQEE